MDPRSPSPALFSLASAGCGGSAPAAVPEGIQGMAELAAEVKALERPPPDQPHIMADVGDRFANLGFAGEAEDWPLAEFSLSGTRSHLGWAVRAKPIRRDDAVREIDLPGVLEAFERTQLAQAEQAVGRNDEAAFEAVYEESPSICYACRRASDRPYLRPRVPRSPEAGIINLDPKADRPL